MSYDEITVTEAGGVTTITLNRPEARNALNRNLRRELTVVIRLGHRGRVIVLTGQGLHFHPGRIWGMQRRLTRRASRPRSTTNMSR